MNEAQEIWNLATGVLREQMTAACYNLWMGNITPLRLENGVLLLGAPSDMFCTFLQNSYRSVIEEAITKATALRLSVTFESGHKAVQGDASSKEQSKPSVETVEVSSCEAAKTLRHPRKAEETAAESKETALEERYSFGKFAVSGCNEFVCQACQEVAAHPGESSNPLFLYSGTGLGKTHLLQAIGHRASELHPSRKVLYVTSEDFLNQYIDAMKKGHFAELRRKFRMVDMLLIDDVQFIGTKPSFQEEVFHTFNAIYETNGQIVMTADRPPKEIAGLDKRLVSRFEGGMVAEIKAPDLETRKAIVRQRLAEQSVELDDTVVDYVAEHLKSSVRTLESGVHKLLSWQSLMRRKLDLAAAESLLQALFTDDAKEALSVADIQRVVAGHYDIRIQDMTSSRRPANIAFPRMVAMYFSRVLTELSFPAIAAEFKRNHATVLHAVSTIEAKKGEDEGFARELAAIEAEIRGN